MLTDTAIVPNFDGKAAVFYNEKIAAALEDCQNGGYRALFIPELVDARPESLKESEIWMLPYSSQILRAAGTTRQGNNVVIYAHVENYFSKPENIGRNLHIYVNGPQPIPTEEFERLLGMEDGARVYVIDDSAPTEIRRGIPSIEEALKNVHTIPFFGGRERAEAYLHRLTRDYVGSIEQWYFDSDLKKLRRPIKDWADCLEFHNNVWGQLLFLGSSPINSLGGLSFQDNVGRFIGVPK
jgi:hypothetical protein